MNRRDGITRFSIPSSRLIPPICDSTRSRPTKESARAASQSDVLNDEVYVRFAPILLQIFLRD